MPQQGARAAQGSRVPGVPPCTPLQVLWRHHLLSLRGLRQGPGSARAVFHIFVTTVLSNLLKYMTYSTVTPGESDTKEASISQELKRIFTSKWGFCLLNVKCKDYFSRKLTFQHEGEKNP